MENYRAYEKHVFEPDETHVRENTPSLSLNDYEALFLTELLREYAEYSGDNDVRSGIALAYAELVEERIYDYQRDIVVLYAHTEAAKDVLLRSVAVRRPAEPIHQQVHEKVMNFDTEFEVDA